MIKTITYKNTHPHCPFYIVEYDDGSIITIPNYEYNNKEYQWLPRKKNLSEEDIRQKYEER